MSDSKNRPSVFDRLGSKRSRKKGSGGAEDQSDSGGEGSVPAPESTSASHQESSKHHRSSTEGNKSSKSKTSREHHDDKVKSTVIPKSSESAELHSKKRKTERGSSEEDISTKKKKTKTHHREKYPSKEQQDRPREKILKESPRSRTDKRRSDKDSYTHHQRSNSGPSYREEAPVASKVPVSNSPSPGVESSSQHNRHSKPQKRTEGSSTNKNRKSRQDVPADRGSRSSSIAGEGSILESGSSAAHSESSYSRSSSRSSGGAGYSDGDQRRERKSRPSGGGGRNATSTTSKLAGEKRQSSKRKYEDGGEEADGYGGSGSRRYKTKQQKYDDRTGSTTAGQRSSSSRNRGGGEKDRDSGAKSGAVPTSIGSSSTSAWKKSSSSSDLAASGGDRRYGNSSSSKDPKKGSSSGGSAGVKKAATSSSSRRVEEEEDSRGGYRRSGGGSNKYSSYHGGRGETRDYNKIAKASSSSRDRSGAVAVSSKDHSIDRDRGGRRSKDQRGAGGGGPDRETSRRGGDHHEASSSRRGTSSSQAVSSIQKTRDKEASVSKRGHYPESEDVMENESGVVSTSSHRRNTTVQPAIEDDKRGDKETEHPIEAKNTTPEKPAPLAKLFDSLELDEVSDTELEEPTAVPICNIQGSLDLGDEEASDSEFPVLQSWDSEEETTEDAFRLAGEKEPPPRTRGILQSLSVPWNTLVEESVVLKDVCRPTASIQDRFSPAAILLRVGLNQRLLGGPDSELWQQGTLEQPQLLEPEPWKHCRQRLEDSRRQGLATRFARYSGALSGRRELEIRRGLCGMKIHQT